MHFLWILLSYQGGYCQRYIDGPICVFKCRDRVLLDCRANLKVDEVEEDPDVEVSFVALPYLGK